MAGQSKVDPLDAAIERLEVSPASKHFRFLDLPKEIRLMVYERLPRTVKHTTILVSGLWSEYDEDFADTDIILVTHSTSTPVLSTCKLIYSESVDIVKQCVQEWVLDSGVGVMAECTDTSVPALGAIFGLARNIYVQMQRRMFYGVSWQSPLFLDKNGVKDSIINKGIADCHGLDSTYVLGKLSGHLFRPFAWRLAQIAAASTLVNHGRNAIPTVKFVLRHPEFPRLIGMATDDINISQVNLDTQGTVWMTILALKSSSGDVVERLEQAVEGCLKVELAGWADLNKEPSHAVPISAIIIDDPSMGSLHSMNGLDRVRAQGIMTPQEWQNVWIP